MKASQICSSCIQPVKHAVPALPVSLWHSPFHACSSNTWSTLQAPLWHAQPTHRTVWKCWGHTQEQLSAKKKWGLEDKCPSFLASWVHQFWGVFPAVSQMIPAGLSPSHSLEKQPDQITPLGLLSSLPILLANSPAAAFKALSQVLLGGTGGNSTEDTTLTYPMSSVSGWSVRPHCHDLRVGKQATGTKKEKRYRDLLQDTCYQFSLFQIENTIIAITHWILLNLSGSCFHRHLSPSIISLLLNHNSFSISQKTERQFREQWRQNWLIGETYWEYQELTNKESLKHLPGTVKKENQQTVPFWLMWDRSVGGRKKGFLRNILIFLLLSSAAIRYQPGTPILHLFSYVFISGQHSCLKLESWER